MAWRSSGTTNDEMVDNLKRFGVISSSVVERGFRNVDRKYFVPREREDIAHADQPLREGNIHISAPHIYGSALEALELRENVPLSFLNLGSGTGYLSCIVASILGPYSTNYGVEINDGAFRHGEEAIARWKSVFPQRLPHMQTVHGNVLSIALDEGEALIGFDRVYVGASIEPSDLSKLTALLKPGGILVGPVGDELVKIVRIKRSLQNGESVDDFTPQVLSGVRFASLLSHPNMRTILPSRVWSPAIHKSYPESFRRSSRELLLCSHAPMVQPVPPEKRPESRTNLAACLPRAIWLEILSYTHHNWFEPPQSDEALLRQRLQEEQENARKAHQARMEAEARCHIAERERDVYRLLARRWQSRLQVLLQQQRSQGGSNSNEADLDEEIITLNGRESAVIFGLGAMLRGFPSESDEEADNQDGPDNEMDAEDTDQDGQDQDEEDEELEDESNEGNYIFLSEEDEQVPDMEESEASSLSMSNSESRSMAFVRPQVRTVSIADDF